MKQSGVYGEDGREGGTGETDATATRGAGRKYDVAAAGGRRASVGCAGASCGKTSCVSGEKGSSPSDSGEAIEEPDSRGSLLSCAAANAAAGALRLSSRTPWPEAIALSGVCGGVWSTCCWCE